MRGKQRVGFSLRALRGDLLRMLSIPSGLRAEASPLRALARRALKAEGFSLRLQPNGLSSFDAERLRTRSASGRSLRMRSTSGEPSARRPLRLMALAMAFLITALIALYRERLRELSGYGYPGVFLISLLGNATVVFPVPSLMAVFAGGGVFNPAIVGLVAGVGEALGELTGYMAGYGGQAVVEDRGRYERLEGWMRRNGIVTIFALSLIPNPFFDLAGIAAGALRFPLGPFLLSCWLGKTMKTLGVAFAGAYSISFIERLLGA